MGGIQASGKYDQRHMGVEMRGKYPTTWASPDGKASRKIDYIMINAKYANTARTAQRNTRWRANMNKNQKCRVQTMKLY